MKTLCSCKGQGACLAEIGYAAEQAFVADNLKSVGMTAGARLAIGLKTEGGVTKWTGSGSQLSYENWYQNIQF